MNIPKEVDLVVLGSGAAGMTAALTASALGQRVVLIEKTAQIGGTTARSAGSVWAPNSKHSPPGSDTVANALEYLRGAIGNRLDNDRVTAFLDAAPEMIAFLEDRTAIRFRAYPHHPDYLASLSGATLSGRVLEPFPFDGRLLGKRFKHIRSPLPEFVLFGGMMVDRGDIYHLMRASRNLTSLGHSLRLLARFAWDRVGHARGTRLVMGNALVGHLYHAMVQCQIPVLLGSKVTSLVQRDKRVVGVTLERAGSTAEILSRAGVVLATGGVSHDSLLRRSLMPESLGAESAVVESATGDGLGLAERSGGFLCSPHDSNSFWAPVSHKLRADGTTAVFPHFVLDRGKPGALAVDPNGKRFVNEATTYHFFGEALFSALRNSPEQACFLICDDPFIVKYGLGIVRPKRLNLNSAITDKYLYKADSIKALAETLNIPSVALIESVARHNAFADKGVDRDFGKGEDAYQQNLGDASHQPNPCLGKCQDAPFYAVKLVAGDIGASAGIATDQFSRVLKADGVPVDGLYACGNDMESIMAGHYPGPGITLGPGMTFGYLAAKHACERT